MDETTAPKGTIDRAFTVLKCFQPEDSAGVGVSELARRAGLSKSTTHRILNSLVKHDAVVKANDIYRLGPLFNTSLTSATGKENELVSEVLTPYLSALFERTRHTVHLGFLLGTDVVYANKLFSFRGVDAPSRIGGRVPGYCTGVGKAILAFDEPRTEDAIKLGLHPWTPYTLTDPAEFRSVLGKVREEGLAYDRQEITEGLTCVAAPIFGQGPIPVAAMSVSGVAGQFEHQKHIDTLLQITRSASKAFARAHAKTARSQDFGSGRSNGNIVVAETLRQAGFSATEQQPR